MASYLSYKYFYVLISILHLAYLGGWPFFFHLQHVQILATRLWHHVDCVEHAECADGSKQKHTTVQIEVELQIGEYAQHDERKETDR